MYLGMAARLDMPMDMDMVDMLMVVESLALVRMEIMAAPVHLMDKEVQHLSRYMQQVPPITTIINMALATATGTP